MDLQIIEGKPGVWNARISKLPGAHVLQSWEWGQVKAGFGWRPSAYLWERPSGEAVAAALALTRSIPIGGLSARLGIVYIPKGPLLAWDDRALRSRVLDDIARLARREGAIFIKIDPDVRLGSGTPGEPEAVEEPSGREVVAELCQKGWRLSDEQIQFRNTVLLDLRPDLDTLLARMKQKTRYNIRLAERKGVSIRLGSAADIDLLFQMYAKTANRDGFVIRDRAYYQLLWNTFIGSGLAEPLIAEVDDKPVAAMVIFRFANRAWYMNGMSGLEHREKMPSYLLQWEAIRRLKEAQVHTYDLWGAPDVFDPGDSMWGVYRFKEGFGGEVARHIGAYDLPLRPLLYRFYIQILPRLLNVMRRRGVESTRRLVESA